MSENRTVLWRQETANMSIMDRIKTHVHYLSVEIGPRGSTTPAERHAAEYAKKVYTDLGLSPLVEYFLSAKSAWQPFTLGMGMVLIMEVIFWFGKQMGSAIAAIIAFLTVVSLILELSFISNPLRWVLPKGKSQNVSVRLDPAENTWQMIILVSHLDTNQMPISHCSQRWVNFFKRMTTITFGSALLLLFFLVGVFIDWKFLRPISLIPTFSVMILFLMAMFADHTPFSHGANDNATGVAITMGLTEQLTKASL